MITESRVANAIGGKSARACDSCLRHRARWYCASDDAFLCQSCDSSVHAANHVASKHKRVRLNTSSSKPKRSVVLEHALPSWPQGVTRKAKTPLNHARSSMNEQSKRKESDVGVLVPELSCEEDAPLVENEAQTLFQVPVYDPLEDELCNIGIDDIFKNKANETAEGLEHGFLYPGEELESFSGFLPPDVDLAELTADVESFLGNETLELGKRVKVEESEMTNMSTDMVDDCWEFNEVKEEVKTVMEDGKMGEYYEEENQKNAFLRLNYEAVITAWGSQGSPWTTGSRPEFNPDDCFTDLKVLPLFHYAFIHTYVHIFMLCLHIFVKLTVAHNVLSC